MDSRRDRNNRETGARKLEARPDEVDRDKVGLKAAENHPSGLTAPTDDTMEKTRQSDAVDQRAKRVSGSRKRASGPVSKEP